MYKKGSDAVIMKASVKRVTTRDGSQAAEPVSCQRWCVANGSLAWRTSGGDIVLSSFSTLVQTHDHEDDSQDD